jgi:hypothetical protein
LLDILDSRIVGSAALLPSLQSAQPICQHDRCPDVAFISGSRLETVLNG